MAIRRGKRKKRAFLKVKLRTGRRKTRHKRSKLVRRQGEAVVIINEEEKKNRKKKD